MKKIILPLFCLALCLSPALAGGTADAGGQVWPEKSAKTRPPAVPKAVRPKTLRAVLESAAMLTGATIDYWHTYEDFREDWQFDLTWADQRRRFFSAESPKFDSNAFWFNWSHALAGAGYYSWGRANGLGWGSALLFSLGTSTIWETICEWREIISLNDLLFSSFGGPAIGEPFFQAASHFSRRRGILNQVAAFLLDPFLAVNNWLDLRAGPAANSGPAPGWHRFGVFAGPRRSSYPSAGAAAREFEIGLEMETVTVPGYGLDPGFRRALSTPLSSRVAGGARFGPAGMEEFSLRTRAVLFGRAWQSLGSPGSGTSEGSGGAVGFAMAFQVYRKRPVAWYDSSAEVPGGGPSLSDARFERPTPTEFTDKMGVISPAGMVLALNRFGPRLHVRWTAAVFGDFGLINALAYNAYTAGHDPSGVKSTLLNWGYYYGLGMTLVSDILADWRSWHGTAAVRYQAYGSIQGQDRYQFLGVVTDDFRVRDSRLEWRAGLAYRLPGTPLELGLNAEGVERRGGLLDIRSRTLETGLSARLEVVF